MKKLFLLVLLIKAYETHAQLPLPCLNYDENNLSSLQNFSGTRSARCIDIDMHPQPNDPQITLSDNHNREFTVDEGTIHPGFTYEPGSDANAELSIVTGQRSEMEGVWLEPINYYPQLYEKIEWGVKLPAEVELAIDNWIHNDQHPDEPTQTPALNPFDPDQIDLQAIIDYWDENAGFHSQPIFGFFFREYERLTSYTHPENPVLDDVNEWKWLEHSTAYRFRFRWASDVIAHHAVRIHLNVPSMGEWEMEPFEFDSYWGDPRNSFISVTNNKHYFKTADGHVFFPVGLNINEGTFGCACMEGVSEDADCDECYEMIDDPCCGIDINKRKRQAMTGTHIKEYTVGAAGYVKLEKILEILADKGGNSYRTFFDPMSFDIEFEKMNNYYERQYQAWEFDNVLNKCNDLNLHLEWNMQIHNSIMYHAQGYDRWDWNDQYNCNNCGVDTPTSGTTGFCYWHDCPNMDTPVDFLSNECAVYNYKKKLRYMIARWGYSKNIYTMELMSEINNIGVDQTLPESQQVSLYNSNPTVTRPAVAWWHNEMARYIKEDLHHTRHLIGASYTGRAPITGSASGISENPCQDSWFDWSWNSPYIDVMAWSNYEGGILKFKGMATSNYGAYGGGTPSQGIPNHYSGLLCGWDNPDQSNDDGGYHSPVMGYNSIWKPAINSEMGNYGMGCDHTGFVKELMVSPFTGMASSGMSWDEWSSTEHWHWMGNVTSFLETEFLNSIDLNNENWEPGYEQSGGGDDQEQVEMIYLKSSEDNHHKVIGVINNRTWNWFSSADSPNCPSSLNSIINQNDKDAVMPASYQVQLDLGFDEEKLKLHHMENEKRYRIQYFDPANTSIINEEIVTSDLGVLPLADYPILTIERPMVFFKVFRDPIGSNSDEFMPEISDSWSSWNRLDQQSIGLTRTDEFNLNNDIQRRVVPNPAIETICILPYPKLKNEFVIYDLLGTIVLTFKSDSGKIDNTDLSSGIYYIKIKNDPHVLTFEKIGK